MIFFGLGPNSAIFLVFLGAFYPILLNTIFGVRSVDARLFEAAEMLGCSGSQLFRAVVLPAALAEHLQWTAAWRRLCLDSDRGRRDDRRAEGLGAVIMDGRTLSRTDLVITGMIVIGITGFFSDRILAPAQQLFPSLEPAASCLRLKPANPRRRRHCCASTVCTRCLPPRTAQSKRCAASISRSKRANSSACLARRAAANPRCCASSPVSRRRHAAQSPYMAPTSIGPGPTAAWCFRTTRLFPWLTVRENINFGPRHRGVPTADIANVSERFLAMVGLTAFADRYPHQLSGGMKQRVAIARVLANDTDILLMDEPFGALDALTRSKLQEELIDIWQSTKLTVIFVTHSVEEAVLLADRVVVMTAGPGRVSTSRSRSTCRVRGMFRRPNSTHCAVT